MTSLKLYAFLKEKGLLRKEHPEFAEQLEEETKREEQRTDFILWKESLGEDKAVFEEMFGSEEYNFSEE